MSRLSMLYILLLLGAVSAGAQTGTAPVLTTRPYAPYPDAARKAHLGGEAVVAFSIDHEGKTLKVHTVSGPEVLTSALAAEIRDWRFVTPLPRDAEKDFVAHYTYSIVEREMEDEKKLKPGEDDVVPGPIAAVSGVVRSVDNRQNIDATPYLKTESPASEP